MPMVEAGEVGLGSFRVAGQERGEAGSAPCDGAIGCQGSQLHQGCFRQVVLAAVEKGHGQGDELLEYGMSRAVHAITTDAWAARTAFMAA